jgi:hypothetical protein
VVVVTVMVVPARSISGIPGMVMGTQSRVCVGVDGHVSVWHGPMVSVQVSPGADSYTLATGIDTTVST